MIVAYTPVSVNARPSWCATECEGNLRGAVAFRHVSAGDPLLQVRPVKEAVMRVGILGANPVEHHGATEGQPWNHTRLPGGGDAAMCPLIP
jgi:hypothetical protein